MQTNTCALLTSVTFDKTPNPMLKKRIAIVCGGFSGEKEISLQSGAMIMDNIDRTLYDPVLIVIDKTGWVAKINGEDFPVDKNDFSVLHNQNKLTFDAAFIAIHGTPGEDGKLQGYFEMLGIPYNTGGVLNMALTFDKFATVSMLRRGGFRVSESMLVKKGEAINQAAILDKLGLPCFVKPTNAGSSLGISKVKTAEELLPAIETAMRECNHVMIEAMVKGTEMTCGVLQRNGRAQAIQITEIVSHNEFFDYQAKYLGKSDEITPARIPADKFEECLRLSESIFNYLNCRGFARIDFILQDNELYCIEVNTVPGMSAASILPQQCAVYGMSNTEMISGVIENSLNN
jgi:D-alanine-D-alanine ligase